jgi:hypothetical protein
MVRKAPAVDMKKLARIGAAARLKELQDDIAALKQAFPGLRVLSVDVIEAPDGTEVEVERVAREVADGRRRRKPLTAAQKKAVSDRMRKYWAVRKGQ